MNTLRSTLLLCVSLLTLTLSAQQPTARVDKQLEIFNDVMRQLDVNYVDTLNYEKLISTAIEQMLRQVDPYTVYYSEDDSKKLREMTTGQYGGIGAVIQQREEKNQKGEKIYQCYIANPYEGLPAQRNGLKAGDKILSVDGTKVTGMTVSEVSKRLRGLPGSTITVEILRPGDKKSQKITFQREEIRMEPVRYYCAYKADSLAQPVGYIYFLDFTENSSRDFQLALDDLVKNEHIGSLIIDLRDNGGGIIGEAVNIVNLFVDRGTMVVNTKGKNDEPQYEYKTRHDVRYPNLPLVIMVNKNTASAAEIVAGSLQDLGRATLVGQRTYGKGLVQSIRTVAHNGSLKVTTARYYLPSGRCIQAIDYAERQKGNDLKRDTAGGILPDIVIDDSAKLDVSYALYVKNMYFDYATRYHQQHEELLPPLRFELTDEDIEDFCRFLDEQKFEYETETSKYYKQLLDMARHEDLDSTTMQQLTDLQQRMRPDYREAIRRNLDRTKELLGREIVLRYYYQKGEIAYQLRFDKELRRALSECRRRYDANK
ncbi:MAG: S41 family peptidase [Paludibacteraceae bacterium]|nr:S41 family peptidase [Paludibacteraceae bacterium]